jgi:hypothetical protein
VFSERTEHEKNRFMSYIFPTETMTSSRSARSSPMSIEEHHYENFDRINRGKPLSDNDKYWCRKTKPMVKFSIELINILKESCPFMQTKSFGTKTKDGKINRIVLEKICTIVGAILYNVYKKSYSRHYVNLCIPITNEKKNEVYHFLNNYVKIYSKIYTDVPKKTGEQIKDFNNPGKFLALIIMDFKVERPGKTNQDKINMWADILNIDRASSNFMKGTQTLYNSFTDGDKKNQEISNIEKRLERIIEFYNEKQMISERYHIEYNNYIVENSESENESDDSNESENESENDSD